MKSWKILGVMFGLLAPLCGAEPAKQVARPPVKVACVGDSITQGVGAGKGKSYPSQLQALLGAEWKVGNFGVSGRTLLKKGDFPYWKEGAFTKAQEFGPEVVIIMLGTNDTKPQNWKFKAEFEGDYRELIQTFQKLSTSPKVFICRPVPVPEPGNFGINETALQEQMPVLTKLAGELKAGVIDMHAALDGKPEMLPDRVHPNDDGTAAMAKAAFDALTAKASAAKAD